MSAPLPAQSQPVKNVRCAIYTRKSTEEGLQQAFNTLDAQRESAEAYITAHKHEGWVCLPERYDDGGYTGGNLDRPAFQRLMTDVEAGKVDAIVIYKIDRLSRSLMDFSRVMELLEKRNVALIAITQSLDTKTSMGRLTLNILLSFAQFEREIISERTRDKIAAARRKGKFAGGRPVLGYDIERSVSGSRLLVNPVEAEQVRVIFGVYLEQGSLIPAVMELNGRGWRTKAYPNRGGAGTVIGGHAWGKTALFKLLTNPIYIGKVAYKAELHTGEHEGIVDPGVFQKVQSLLKRNRLSPSSARNKHGALLRGLLWCGCCRCAMTHAYTRGHRKRGTGKLYRYYVCQRAQKLGWQTCQSKSVPAGGMEAFVIDQIRGIGSDPTLVSATIEQLQKQHEAEIADLQTRQKVLVREIGRLTATRTSLLASDKPDATALGRVQEQINAAEKQVREAGEQLTAAATTQMTGDEVRRALAAFDPVWDSLTPREQERLIHLLVERVTYDGAKQTVSITYRPAGIKTLALQHQEAA